MRLFIADTGLLGCRLVNSVNSGLSVNRCGDGANWLSNCRKREMAVPSRASGVCEEIGGSFLTL